MLDIKRREFIALVGGGGLTLAAKVRRALRAQPRTTGRALITSGGLPGSRVNA